jgi:hypothetical protein
LPTDFFSRQVQGMRRSRRDARRKPNAQDKHMAHYCPECGGHLAEIHNYCPQCGVSLLLVAGPRRQPSEPVKTNGAAPSKRRHGRRAQPA